MTRNINKRLRTSIRKDVFTVPLAYRWVPEPHHLFPDLIVERPVLVNVTEWVWLTGDSSTANPRPHMRAWARKQPRTYKDNDDDETNYDRRGRVRMARRVLREHYDAQYDDGMSWQQGMHDVNEDVSRWIDRPGLAAWERELLKGAGRQIRVGRRLEWRYEPTPEQVIEDEDTYLRYGIDDLPRPMERNGRILRYTTETPRNPTPATTKVEHFHPSQGRGVINAISRSSNRGDVVRVNRVRVYELARELGVTSAHLVQHLRDTGEYVKSASSVIEPPVVRRVRADLGHQEALA